MKEYVDIIAAVVSLIVGWGLTIAAFIVEPTGQVHDSVLWALGQALTFSGSILGAKSYIDYRTHTNNKNTL